VGGNRSVVMKRLKVVWSEVGSEAGSEVKWSEVKGREGKGREGKGREGTVLCGMHVLPLILVMQFVCGLLYCALSYCFVYLSHCFLCTRLSSVIRFMIILFFVPFAFYFVCSVLCIVLYIVSPHVYLFLPTCVQFTDLCHRVKSQLQLINIISYNSAALGGGGGKLPTTHGQKDIIFNVVRMLF
jgi:hypothetical protein